jgi:molybdenum cofactor synthesis domain-containing protein
MDKIMKVISVNISTEKGTVKNAVPSVNLNTNGITEDAHSGSWHRQVSILGTDSIKRFAAQMGRDLKPGEFAENITMEGFDWTESMVGDKIRINEVELEVTQIGKSCHGDGCAIYREVGKCVMPKEGIFCRVITGGTIKPGDEAVYTKIPSPFLILTISDRASKGEYEDLSGPVITEHIHGVLDKKRWRLELHRKIVPDEQEQIAAAIKAAVSDGYAAVFTTGGTGIGPRDVTPEVIDSLPGKELTGIMDFIRIKYGEKNPNALLSRSVAKVCDKTIIFALPGSRKACVEYMQEIGKLLEHALFMVKNVDLHHY